MKIQKRLIAAVFVISLFSVFCIGEALAWPTVDCATLLGSQHAGQINSADVVPSGSGLPEYCKVTGTIEPAVNYEIRLPTTGWNGKLLHVGCYVFCGFIPTSLGNDALARGYAVVGTDSGHTGSMMDCSFGYNNDQAEIDYGYRAVHIVTDAAKHLIRDFYRRPARFSYFRGCSTGGRQALIEAQRFPNDFNGIIAGDPIMFYTGVAVVAHGWPAIVNRDEEGNPVLTVDKLPLIDAAVYEACDGLDGLVDGIIDDPRRCDFDPTSLMCEGGGPGSDCLSAEQVEVLEKFYNGARNSADEPLFPGGFVKSSELSWANTHIGANSPMGIHAVAAQGNLQYLMFNVDPGPTYSLYDFNLDTDIGKLHEKAWIYNATDTDMSEFRNRGGKLILYAGTTDGTMPYSMSYYYDRVAEQMRGLSRIKKWFRFFMVPGMGHCSGGPGPSTFDMLKALEDWVEHRIAPDRVIASHSTSGVVDRTRPLCPYPQVARWNGRGGLDGINHAENFKCVEPDYVVPPNDWDHIDYFSWDQFE